MSAYFHDGRYELLQSMLVLLWNEYSVPEPQAATEFVYQKENVWRQIAKPSQWNGRRSFWMANIAPILLRSALTAIALVGHANVAHGFLL